MATGSVDAAGGGDGERTVIEGLDDCMGVVAAEAEGRHAGAAHAFPRFGCLEDPHPTAAHGGVQDVGVEARGPDPVLEGFEHLHDPGDARGRDEVAEIGLERADRKVAGIREDAGRAAELGPVADRGTRGVALEQADISRRETGCLVCVAECPGLTVLGRSQQSASASVVRQPDPTDDAVDDIPVPQCVLEALQHEHARTLCRHEAVGLRVEGTGAAGLREGLQRAEADVDEEVVGTIDRTGEHQVGRAVLQAVAGELERVEGTGAGRVEGEPDAAESEGLRHQQGGETRHEAVARVRVGQACGRGGLRTEAGHAVQPDALREPAHSAARESEVAEDRPAPAQGVGARCDAGIGKCGPGRVQAPVDQRVQPREFLCGNLEAVGLPDLREAVDVPAALRPCAVGRIVRVGGQDVGASHTPAALRRGAHEITAADDRVPEGLGGERTGQDHGPPDDGNGGGRHGRSRRGLGSGAAGQGVGLDPLQLRNQATLGVDEGDVRDGLAAARARPVSTPRSGPATGASVCRRTWPMPVGRVGPPSTSRPQSRAT